MHYSQSEKMEIIRIIENSEIGVVRTLRKLGIHPSVFYRWYNDYQERGYDGLARKKRKQFWNKIPSWERDRIVRIAKELPDRTPRELAWYITDNFYYSISESSVYRILKEHGLIPSPAYMIISADDEFKRKTARPNQMWQTDFTYLKVIHWGWYYLSTVLDDYSRYIIAWDLRKYMKSKDAEETIRMALENANRRSKTKSFD